LSGVQEDVRPLVEGLRQADPDAIAYLGWGLPAMRMNDVFRDLGWDPLRVMSAAFMTAPVTPEGPGALLGWHGIDQYDEENTVTADFLDRFERRFAYRPANYIATLTYDSGTVIAHAIARARPIAPEGVKRGLERIKMLPAATGGPRTLISFAPYIRRSWLGPDYLVVREVVESDGHILRDFGTALRHRMRPRSASERRRWPGS
jgi:ABC-type branched-subunit amino acid transport system substrate-binding protein